MVAAGGLGRTRLPPVVPWPSTGAMQTGELYSALLHLHNMARLTFGQLDENARIFITDWLEKMVRSPLPSQMGGAVRETLRRAGFTGCGEYLETVDGFFFPQYSPANASDSEVFVAKDIFFDFGAPGLLPDDAESGMAQFRDGRRFRRNGATGETDDNLHLTWHQPHNSYVVALLKNLSAPNTWRRLSCAKGFGRTLI